LSVGLLGWSYRVQSWHFFGSVCVLVGKTDLIDPELLPRILLIGYIHGISNNRREFCPSYR